MRRRPLSPATLPRGASKNFETNKEAGDAWSVALKLFEAVDDNGDGELSWAELHEYLSGPQARTERRGEGGTLTSFIADSFLALVFRVMLYLSFFLVGGTETSARDSRCRRLLLRSFCDDVYSSLKPFCR